MDSGLVVPDDDGDRGSVPRFIDQYFPLRELEKFDPENYKVMVDMFSAVGDNLVGDFIADDWSKAGEYISDVITFADDRERDILHQYLSEQGDTFPRKMFGFAFEEDHVHIIHTCAFSNGQCKCGWKKKVPCGLVRRGYKFRSDISKWTATNFILSFLYLFFKKQTGTTRNEIWRDGTRQRLHSRIENIRWERLEDFWKGLLSSCESTAGWNVQQGRSNRGGLEDFYREDDRPQRSEWSSPDGSKFPKAPKQFVLSKWQRVSTKVSALLSKYAICPLEGLRSEKEFLEDDFLTDPDNSVRVREAINIWSYKINNYTLKDYLQMYSLHESKQVFSRSKSYYDMDDSTKHLDDLLLFQFDNEHEEIKNFLQDLVNVIDWQPIDNPNINIKCNTFLVHSEPSAGKNFFFDTIFTLLLNFGQLGTANRNNNFAFQDAVNRRIILWNEPNYESSVTDYLKTLFEGGDTKVRVKMIGDTHVKRTPIIILTNNVVNFMNDIGFNDRIKQYRWKPAPYLKDLQLKPYPLSFFNILLKYEIKF